MITKCINLYISYLFLIITEWFFKNEKELLQEIQVLGEYWTREDEENTQKVFEIIALDEKIQIATELVCFLKNPNH